VCINGDLDVTGAYGLTGALTVGGTLDANGQVDLGDNGDTVTIDSSDWNINATGDMSGIGSIGANGLATLSLGATISGATASLNASSNFDTNINTGTSTGAATIGNGGGTVAVLGSGWGMSTAGAFTGAASIATEDNQSTLVESIGVTGTDAASHTIDFQIDGDSGLSIAATGDGAGHVGVKTLTATGGVIVNPERISALTADTSLVKLGNGGDLLAGTGGGTSGRTNVVEISATRPLGTAFTGGGDDNGLKVAVTNRNIVAQDSYILRAATFGATNRGDGGTLGTLNGAYISATQKGEGATGSPVTAELAGLKVKVEQDSPNATVPTALYGVNVEYDAVMAAPAASAGLRVYQNSDTGLTNPTAAISVERNAALASRWVYGLDFGATAATVETAEIRGSNDETIDNVTNGSWTFNGKIVGNNGITDSGLGAGVLHAAGGSASFTSSLIATADITAGAVTSTELADTICLRQLSVTFNPSEAAATDDYVDLFAYDPVTGVADFDTVEANVDNFIVSAASVAHSMAIAIDVAPGAGKGAWTIVVRDDAASTTLTCSIDEAAVACTDVTHAPAIVAASKLDVLVTSTDAGGAPDAAAAMTIAFCLGQ